MMQQRIIGKKTNDHKVALSNQFFWRYLYSIFKKVRTNKACFKFKALRTPVKNRYFLLHLDVFS
jgi:hypothetical protein